MKSIKSTALALVILVAVGAAPANVHEVTYMGTVTSVSEDRIEVMVIDERTGSQSPMTFAMTEQTQFYRGDHRLTIADVNIQVEERIAVTVNTDVPGNRALTIRLADHHQ